MENEIIFRWSKPIDPYLKVMLNLVLVIKELTIKFRNKKLTGHIRIPWIELENGVQSFTKNHYDFSVLDTIEHSEFLDRYLKMMETVPKNRLFFDEKTLNSAICRCIERKNENSLISLLNFVKKRNIKPQYLYILVKYAPFDMRLYGMTRNLGFIDTGIEKGKVQNLSHLTYIGYRISQHIIYYENNDHLRFLLDYWEKLRYYNCTCDAAMDLLVPDKEGKKEVIYDDLSGNVQVPEGLRKRRELTGSLLFEKMKKVLNGMTKNDFLKKYWNKENRHLFTYF